MPSLQRSILSSLLASFAAFLFLALMSCATKERKPVPPPASSASNIPWNDPSLNPSSGGLLGGALSR